MDFQQKIDLLSKQIALHDMVLQNIRAMSSIAPPGILQQQLDGLESTMVHKTDSLPKYFPKSSDTGYVYVLLLEGDEVHDKYYYVGYTQDVSKRLGDHFSSNGSEWTKLHPPISVLEVVEADKTEERNKTIQVMKKHGWELVRGYCWTAKNLKGPPRELET